ncbi:hydrogenase maturation protease [Robertkochia aurantiaca]|uniref:hydrogenase maturation protease n=1 Tax=Robertkochia aurantiaca TaxID=2873700 RepID=UPI001CCD1DE4|nr:hydrogenase maturation protease [Robertkochia sp. 3YJGBD-33]
MIPERSQKPTATSNDAFFFEKDKAGQILILGIGNYLMGDEGVGPQLIQEMARGTLPSYLDILDGGTGGFLLLNYFEAYRHIIFVDATLDGKPSGTVSQLRPRFASDFPSALSVHDLGLKDMVEAVYLMEKVPDIHLFTISIEKVVPMSVALSDAVQEAIPGTIEKILQLANQIKTTS